MLLSLFPGVGGICLSMWPLVWAGVGLFTPWRPQGIQTLAWQLGAASIGPQKTKPITSEPQNHTAASPLSSIAQPRVQGGELDPTFLKSSCHKSP